MSINKFIGIGNITRDAEIRNVGDLPVAKFGLAMSERYRKRDGDYGENTEFINVELWGQAGVYQYLVKGQMVYVEGSIKTDKWQGQDGQQRSETKIRAVTVQLLGSRPQTQQQAHQPAPQPQPQYPQYQQAPAYPAAAQRTAPAPQQPPQYPAYPTPAPAPAQNPAPAPQYQQPSGRPIYPQYAPQPQQNAVDDLPPDNYEPNLGL